MSSLQPYEKYEKHSLFAEGYRACDTVLIALLVGGPVAVYFRPLPFDWFGAGVLSVSFVSFLGLLRVKAAFALLALPFFGLAVFAIVRAFFLDPTDAVNPIAVGSAAIEVVIAYIVGSYFWKKFSGTDFVNWTEAQFRRLAGKE